jgi:hypothetical protein
MNAGVIVAICTGSVSAVLAIAIPYVQRITGKREKLNDRALVQRSDHERDLYLKMVQIRSYTRAVLGAIEDSLNEKKRKPMKAFPKNSVYTDIATILGLQFPEIASSYHSFMHLAASIEDSPYRKLSKDGSSAVSQLPELRRLRENLKKELNAAAKSIGYDVVGDELVD